MVNIRATLACCLLFCGSTPVNAAYLKDKGQLQLSLESAMQQQELRESSLNMSMASTREARPVGLQLFPAAKSRKQAFFRSLLLPGLGQHYAESRKMMTAFIVSEVLLWGSYIGFNTWGNWLEDDMKAISVDHARVDPQGKTDDYFVDIGNFNNIDAYNQAQLRDRDLADVYNDRQAFFWAWDSEENRAEFEEIRVRGDAAEGRAEFTLAAIFVNHLVSAIHSTLAVYKLNQRLQEQRLGLKLDFNNRGENRAFLVSIQRYF